MYKTKTEFLTNLEKELGRFGVVDKSEIIADFEQHFADSEALGLNEAQACEKLGDIAEIAKSYADEEIYPFVSVGHDALGVPSDALGVPSDALGVPSDALGVPPPPQGEIPPPQQENNSGFFDKINLPNSINRNNLVVVILIDIFILSWAIPALGGLIIGLLGTSLGFFAGGLGVIIGTAVGNIWGFVSPFAPLSNIFFGFMLMSLGGLLAVAGIAAVKSFIKLLKTIINWHGTMIAGRVIFKEEPQNTAKGEQTA